MRFILGLGLMVLAGCMSPPSRGPAIDPDAAREQIVRAIPANVPNRDGWAVDIFAALEALEVPPTADNICAVVAVTDQESNFKVDPPVPNLGKIARKEIGARAARLRIPSMVVGAALEVHSPNGRTYRERLESARTERELSDLYEDFINSVPLGSRLFADWNPVRTGGPMQVSIAFAEQFAREKKYPYPQPGNIRREVFTRRGGMYFGTAHLLAYPASYDAMLYRFADFNAGHHASRNAAFQNAVNLLSKGSLALDGDLGAQTAAAVRKISQLELSETQVHSDLERSKDERFERTRLYARVFELADARQKGRAPRALVPTIRLESPKITRKLTTDWFARRVNDRHARCLARTRA